jgi:hypothetical protein
LCCRENKAGSKIADDWRTQILFMKNHDPKHSDGNEIVVIAWLIVAFSFIILYLIWHMFGYL